jgi:parvulin-like peptidyl-prolyl isomerase
VTRLRLLAIVASLLVIAACGESRTVEDTRPATAATIQGLGDQPVEIPRSELEEVVGAVEGSDRFLQAVFGGELPPAFRQTILTQMIQVEAMESLVADEGGEVTAEDRAEIETALQEELSGLLVDTGDEADTDEVLTEIDPYTQLLIERNSLLTALGRSLTAGQEPGSQEVACVRHILVEEEAEANELLAQLQGGADFAALASEHSTDPGSGAQGGDLGCGPSTQYVSEFAEAVDGAELDEVVGPVGSDFGYHLILVYDRRTEEVPVDTVGPAGQAITAKLQTIEVAVSPDLGAWSSESFSVVDEA